MVYIAFSVLNNTVVKDQNIGLDNGKHPNNRLSFCLLFATQTWSLIQLLTYKKDKQI